MSNIIRTRVLEDLRENKKFVDNAIECLEGMSQTDFDKICQDFADMMGYDLNEERRQQALLNHLLKTC